MTRPVKPRQYHSPLRADQARLTSHSVVDAATALFSELGYAAVSVDAIAAAAGVSRATVFTSVGGKPAILRLAFQAAFAQAAGDENIAMPFVARPRSVEVRSRASVRAYLSGYAGLVTEVFARMAGVYDAIREGSRADPEVGELWTAITEERRRGASTIVADVKKRARLRRGLGEAAAADVVWVLNDPSVYRMLVQRRGWSAKQYSAWLRDALEAALVAR